MMRVLVIGGSGFIGRVLVPRLIGAGHEVGVVQRPASTIPVAPGARSIAADRRRLRDHATALRDFAADVVVDLILSSGRQGAEVVELFGGHATRLVAISSMDVYRAVGVLHGSEEGPLEPLPLHEGSALRSTLQTYPPAQVKALQQIFPWLDDEYDKISVERAVMGNDLLPATVLRLPMIYGPGDPLHRLYPYVKRMDDARPAIVLPASVAAWRGPRGYVENVADAIALAATDARASGRVYNVGEPESLSELEWVRAIAGVLGWRGEVVPVADERTPPALRVPGNLEQHWVVDTTRIRRELGYRERVSREEGIGRTVEWERAHPPTVEPGQFDYVTEDEAVRRARSGDLERR